MASVPANDLFLDKKIIRFVVKLNLSSFNPQSWKWPIVFTKQKQQENQDLNSLLHHDESEKHNVNFWSKSH